MMHLVVWRTGSEVHRIVAVEDKQRLINHLLSPNPPEVYAIAPQGAGRFLLTRQRIQVGSEVVEQVVVDATLEADV